MKIEIEMRCILLISFTLTTLLNLACTPIKTVSGYVPLSTDIETLVVGVSSKKDVLNRLGEPLSNYQEASDFLLYIQQEVETVAFFRPRVSERTVVKLTFDDSAILSNVEVFGTSDLKPPRLEKRITQSEGRKLTFWQQMFGNIGNFSSEQFLPSE